MLTAEQLALRKTGVGASETSAIMGLNPYRTGMAVWMSKFALDDVQDNYHMKRGRYIEDGIRRWVSDELGIDFQPCGTAQHPEHPLVLATPDGISDGAVLEIKSPGPRNYWEYGEGDDLPDFHCVQLAQQMLVLDRPTGYLAAFVGGDVRIYHFSAQEAEPLQAKIVPLIEDWWARYVLTETPPPVDGSREWADYIAERFPEPRAPRKEASSEADVLAMEYIQAIAELKTIEGRRDELKNKLAMVCGDADGIDGQGWRLNLRAPKPRKSFDAGAAYFDGVISEEAWEQYQKTTETKRRFDLRRIR
jgi:putative phage-type endonuclease